ncbi:uncharacterized protein LOC142178612 [Nicotiana tabacum]|uniref:Uncharacterized protein LOC142178612 n=1 Tax=Nicotiana tabacum TaxID=4097 RepID=A0AC58U522_TOBAC
MAAPPNFEEGQSTYRPPRFNDQYYGWWKNRMHDFIMAEDSELWDVICDGPYVPIKKVGEPAVVVPKTRKEYNDADRKAVEKNFRAKFFLVCGIGPDEFNRISSRQSTKEIWEALQTAHEETTHVKQSKIDMLTTEYELFIMKDDESIQGMHTRFTSIINELHSLGEIIPRNKLVRKVLSVLSSSWESKVNAITEAKDLQTLTMDELVENLKTYEMKRKKDSEIREPKNEKNLVLKAENNDSSEEDSDMAYLTRRFQKMVRRNGGIPKRGSSSKPKNYYLCHKCGNPGHFIKDCPLLKQEHFKHNCDKAAKRNPVPDKCFKRKNVADNVMKQALAAWGDSSSESKEENDADDDEDDDNDEVNFRDVQRNLKSYSPKKLMSLANVLIDAYHSLVSDKDALTIELGDAEQTRDDLVVCVVDLKETIENLKNEKEVLTEKIASVEHERDDLMVVVVDLKETTENFSKEKNALVEKAAITEQERDDLLVVIVDLEQTIEGLKAKYRPGNSENGKEVASEAHIKLENELNNVKTSLCAELEKNRQLQAELEKVKNDLEKSFKWTWSPDAITTMYFNNGGHMQGIGFQRENVPYNSHSKTKDETFEVFAAFVKKIQVKMESKVACIRSDHGTEFDNAKFDEFCSENGITHNFSAPRTPQQNGVVERKNRTLEDMARTMLIDSGIAKNFWAEAINTTCYLDQLGKFDAKSDEGIFLGYSSQRKAYKIYNKRTQYVEESVHVIFNETLPSGEKSNKDDHDSEPLLVLGDITDMENGKANMMSQMKETIEYNATSSSPTQEEPGTHITTTEAEERVADTVQSTPQAAERGIQGNHSGLPSSSINEIQVPNWKHKSSHPLDNIITPLDSGVQTRSKARNSLAFSTFLSQIEPKNIKEVLKDAD